MYLFIMYANLLPFANYARNTSTKSDTARLINNESEQQKSISETTRNAF